MIRNIIFDIGNVLLEFRVSMYIERSMLPIVKSIALLEALRGHYQLFAITDASVDQIQYAKEQFAFFTAFTEIVTAETGLRKNDPAIYTYLMEKHHLVPKECVYIDDREENIAAAEKSGMLGILFTDPQACNTALKGVLLP